jgi:hypothetical protein
MTDLEHRGLSDFDNSAIEPYFNWKNKEWSGSFASWYTYSTDSHITDYDADWFEVRSSLAYTWEQENNRDLTLGYTYYGRNDSFYDTQEFYLRYGLGCRWNTELTWYHDFDLYEGDYFTVAMHQVKRDRQWEYRFDLKAGYLSSYGRRIYDNKLDMRTGLVIGNIGGSYSGLGDIEPMLTLTRHFDEESSVSLRFIGSILADRDTYNYMEDDAFAWGISYNLKF